MRIEADAVNVRPALPTAFLFVGEGARSFSKVKLDHTELGSVLGWRRTHLIANKRYIFAADVSQFSRRFAPDEFAGSVSNLSVARSIKSKKER